MTCGPTWVPIDNARVISNRSTGELGHAIVDHLYKERAQITLLEGPVTHALKSKPNRTIKFSFYDELSELFERELKKITTL